MVGVCSRGFGACRDCNTQAANARRITSQHDHTSELTFTCYLTQQRCRNSSQIHFTSSRERCLSTGANTTSVKALHTLGKARGRAPFCHPKPTVGHSTQLPSCADEAQGVSPKPAVDAPGIAGDNDITHQPSVPHRIASTGGLTSLTHVFLKLGRSLTSCTYCANRANLSLASASRSFCRSSSVYAPRPSRNYHCHKRSSENMVVSIRESDYGSGSTDCSVRYLIAVTVARLMRIDG